MSQTVATPSFESLGRMVGMHVTDPFEDLSGVSVGLSDELPSDRDVVAESAVEFALASIGGVGTCLSEIEATHDTCRRAAARRGAAVPCEIRLVKVDIDEDGSGTVGFTVVWFDEDIFRVKKDIFVEVAEARLGVAEDNVKVDHRLPVRW
ncbi:hypothetical protein [Nocardia transvalensis]|uniref:hypothetical protein n=1 Tax=Nocardia transvalensis TaxID=37333 RepID=UPI001895EB18|nr:hypothetical protein [Nocardia transvalensis]MBF6330833.1 hypothetical protein [Nocardia transvalensis]